MLPLVINLLSAAATPVASFGLITDVHYANAVPSYELGSRYYNDSLPKMRNALADIAPAAGNNLSFIIEMGDYKDVDLSLCPNIATPTPSVPCIDAAIDFLRVIESEFVEGAGSVERYHLFGNHDVDVLNQSVVEATVVNGPLATAGGRGYYSFRAANADARSAVHSGLRFIALNGDYTSNGSAWADLDGGKVAGESWDQANVPPVQLAFLEKELNDALANGEKVVVFVHERLDGNGADPPAGKGLGPPLPKSSAGWVNSCSLQNAEAVRGLVEKHPGLVLATFSGHDHAPQPPFTKENLASPLYFTHSAMVEGSLADGHNSYSVVTVMDDCTVVVDGRVDAMSVTVPGPPGCVVKSGLLVAARQEATNHIA